MDLPQNELRGYIRDNGKPMWTAHNNHNITYFEEEEIRIITNNYNTLLGKGAFGEVYKGVLDDNSSVAVKRYIHNVKEDFAKEVIVHCHINHRNVVRLIGCCIGENALMIVTEYMSKGNLSDTLQCSEISISLEKRLGIAIGCAEALSYMHSQMYGQVIHGDIKPANILLDENLNAKISDFGISKLLSTDNTLYMTHALGSIGYMDPLFARTGRLSSKSDVYSFGVVLLELITRRKAVDDGLTENFIQAVAKRKKIREFYDVEVADENNLRILDEIGKLAEKCLAMDLQKRPEMEDVAERLRMLRKSQYQPQKNIFLFGWVRRSKQLPHNMVPTDKHFHGNQVLKSEVQPPQNMVPTDKHFHGNQVLKSEVQPPQNMVPTDKHFHGNQVLKSEVQPPQNMVPTDKQFHGNQVLKSCLKKNSIFKAEVQPHQNMAPPQANTSWWYRKKVASMKALEAEVRLPQNMVPPDKHFHGNQAVPLFDFATQGAGWHDRPSLWELTRDPPAQHLIAHRKKLQLSEQNGA